MWRVFQVWNSTYTGDAEAPEPPVGGTDNFRRWRKFMSVVLYFMGA